MHGLQDGTEDLNSFQLHSWQWRESTRTPPSYLGTTWSWLNWTLELVIRATLVMPFFQFVNKITQEEQTLVGVVGAFCTTLAKAVALVAERSGTNLLQILVSPSPALHDRVQYPHLFSHHSIFCSIWWGSVQFDGRSLAGLELGWLVTTAWNTLILH